MDDFFDDMEMNNHLWSSINQSPSHEYYQIIDYSKFDMQWDDTLDYIIALPEKEDLR